MPFLNILDPNKLRKRQERAQQNALNIQNTQPASSLPVNNNITQSSGILNYTLGELEPDWRLSTPYTPPIGRPNIPQQSAGQLISDVGYALNVPQLPITTNQSGNWQMGGYRTGGAAAYRPYEHIDYLGIEAQPDLIPQQNAGITTPSYTGDRYIPYSVTDADVNTEIQRVFNEIRSRQGYNLGIGEAWQQAQQQVVRDRSLGQGIFTPRFYDQQTGTILNELPYQETKTQTPQEIKAFDARYTNMPIKTKAINPVTGQTMIYDPNTGRLVDKSEAVAIALGLTYLGEGRGYAPGREYTDPITGITYGREESNYGTKNIDYVPYGEVQEGLTTFDRELIRQSGSIYNPDTGKIESPIIDIATGEPKTEMFNPDTGNPMMYNPDVGYLEDIIYNPSTGKNEFVSRLTDIKDTGPYGLQYNINDLVSPQLRMWARNRVPVTQPYLIGQEALTLPERKRLYEEAQLSGEEMGFVKEQSEQARRQAEKQAKLGRTGVGISATAALYGIHPALGIGAGIVTLYDYLFGDNK